MEELDQITALIDKIQEKNVPLGEILAINYNISINMYNALSMEKNDVQNDAFKQLELVCKILDVDYQKMIDQIVQTRCQQFNQSQNDCQCEKPNELSNLIANQEVPEKFSEEEYKKFLENINNNRDTSVDVCTANDGHVDNDIKNYIEGNAPSEFSEEEYKKFLESMSASADSE